MIPKILIIAEAGVNHNGDLNIAKKLIDVAKDAGADIVKFQTFCSKNIVSKFAQKADYQIKTSGSSENQFEMLKKLELSYDNHLELIDYCKKKDITFLSTPFDIDSIEMLDKLNIGIFKVPSGEINNLPYLEKIAKKHKPVIISVGMSTMEEINDALTILKDNGADDITVLHCNTEYPTPFKDVNLNAMKYIESKFNVKVGYSDHTQGIEVPIAAAALGATVIEKHFTLDHNMEGPDHKASLEPDELKAMVSSIRNIEIALGKNYKEPTSSELKNISVVRKSIVAKREILEGEVLTEDNITTKRPGNGISPMKWYSVIGTKAIRSFLEDEMIEI